MSECSQTLPRKLGARPEDSPWLPLERGGAALWLAWQVELRLAHAELAWLAWLRALRAGLDWASVARLGGLERAGLDWAVIAWQGGLREAGEESTLIAGLR